MIHKPQDLVAHVKDEMDARFKARRRRDFWRLTMAITLGIFQASLLGALLYITMLAIFLPSILF